MKKIAFLLVLLAPSSLTQDLSGQLGFCSVAKQFWTEYHRANTAPTVSEAEKTALCDLARLYVSSGIKVITSSGTRLRCKSTGPIDKTQLLGDLFTAFYEFLGGEEPLEKELKVAVKTVGAEAFVNPWRAGISNDFDASSWIEEYERQYNVRLRLTAAERKKLGLR